MSANYYDSVTKTGFHPEAEYLFDRDDYTYDEVRVVTDSNRELIEDLRADLVAKLMIVKLDTLKLGVGDDCKGSPKSWQTFESIDELRDECNRLVATYKDRGQSFRFWMPES